MIRGMSDGNLTPKTDADSFVTEFSYDPLNLVEAINYSGGTEAQFAYNKNGALMAIVFG